MRKDAFHPEPPGRWDSTQGGRLIDQKERMANDSHAGERPAESRTDSPPVGRRTFLAAAAAAAFGGSAAVKAMAAEGPEAATALTPTGDPVADTARLQRAIDAAALAADPRVVVPPGRWEITTLQLRSRVHLELALGAVLAAARNLDLFPQEQRDKDRKSRSCYVLRAEGCTDIVVGGRGTIEGNSSLFPTEPSTWDPQIRAKLVHTSPMVELRQCQRVCLRDITLRDSPSWTVHLIDCDNVRIEGVTIDNDLYLIGNDGVDIDGCRNVIVSNCFIRACDDNICIKSLRIARSCEFITVTNCVLESTCSAIGLGSESWNSIRYVTVSNCVIRNAIRMFQIILWDGGIIEHVVLSNLSGRALTTLGTDRVIHFDIQQHLGENPKLGTLRHVIASNITCETRGRILLTAQDGATMSDITLRDIRLVYPEVEDPAVSVPRSGSTELSNFSPESRVARAAVVADNITGLVLENIVATWPLDPARVATPMNGIWGRKLRGGIIDCPLLTASSAGTERYALKDSDPLIRG
jgi:hypothetical protein